jgi:hypothetical protein
MSLQHQLAVDLSLRAALLPAEAAEWRRQTEANTEGMGIHDSQVKAVNLLLDTLQAKQAKLLAGLQPTLSADEFGRKRAYFESELNGAHGVAAVFRYMLAQRADREDQGRVLDVADRVAADCYRPAIEQAQAWGLLEPDKFREPPLTYFHTAASALALTRRNTLAMVGLKLEGHSELKLPIPVIALPFHQAVAPWSFCGIYHEAGHLLDQDLGFRDALEPRLRAKLGAGDATRTEQWVFWLRELIADAFGVLWGGQGFASYMMGLLLLPEAELTRIDPADEHPPGYLRLLLIAALLRATEVPVLADAAPRFEETWRALYHGTDDLAPYVDECDTVAQVLLHQELVTGTTRHSLGEFAPNLAGEDAQIAILARHLEEDGPAPATDGFPIRLLPSAAQRAVDGLTDASDEQFRTVCERTLAFAETLPRPQTMADEVAFTAPRMTYLRELVEALEFGSPVG